MQIEYELRPCRVTIRERALHGSKVNVYEGLFHRWISEQWTYSPVMQGQVGGQVQSTYGIVELRTGEVKMFSPNQIQFLDNKHAKYAFPKTDHTVRQAVNTLRTELLKHEDLYDAFLASIDSAIRDTVIEIHLSRLDRLIISTEILKRIIGE